jgi:hypothetical protein
MFMALLNALTWAESVETSTGGLTGLFNMFCGLAFLLLVIEQILESFISKAGT